MNIEQLTKTQIVLLTLLVSFVTSIATGIVTVTLVNQAPTDVVRTINTVVEKTVEKVTPGETRIVERIKEVSNPTESDLVVSAIDKTIFYLVLVKSEHTGVESRGIIVSSRGDAIIYVPNESDETAEYNVEWIGDTSTTSSTFKARVKKLDASGFALISPVAVSASTTYPSINLKQSVIPKLGQRVVSVGYSALLGEQIRLGNVTSFIDSQVAEGERRFVIDSVSTISQMGAPVVDLSGRILGVNVGGSESFTGSIAVPTAKLHSVFEKFFVIATSTNSQTATVFQSTP